MRIVCAEGECERELELRLGRPDAMVADLMAAVGVPGGGLDIDGRVVMPQTVLNESGLVHGARVARVGGHAAALRKPVAILRLVGGLEAGRSVALAVGRTVIGRGAEADVRVVANGVSRVHTAFDIRPDGQVTVIDLGSANGTDVGGVRIHQPVLVHPDDLVSLGGEILVRVLPPDHLGPVRRVNPVREAGPGGTLPFNRGPRGGHPGEQPPVAVPAPPPHTHKAPFSLSSMLGPLALAGGTVALTGDLRYAAIAALTPLMFVGNFVEERIRGRSGLRRGMRDYTAKVAEFERAVADRQAAAIQERRAAHPDPAEVAYRAAAPGVRLWERRPAAEDFLRVVAGTADLPWSPRLGGDAQPAPEPAAVLGARSVTAQVPVVVGVSAGEAVGFEGNRKACLAVARTSRTVSSSACTSFAITETRFPPAEASSIIARRWHTELVLPWRTICCSFCPPWSVNLRIGCAAPPRTAPSGPPTGGGSA